LMWLGSPFKCFDVAVWYCLTLLAVSWLFQATGVNTPRH